MEQVSPQNNTARRKRFSVVKILLIVTVLVAVFPFCAAELLQAFDPSGLNYGSVVIIAIDGGTVLFGIIVLFDLIYFIFTAANWIRLRARHIDDVNARYALIKGICAVLASIMILGIAFVSYFFYFAGQGGLGFWDPIFQPTPVQWGGWGPCDPASGACPDKPVIYLYPTHEEPVSVTLNYNGTLTSVYPAFTQGTTWDVDAYPDGHLIDETDGQEYSYLFWEGHDDHQYDLSTGFVVKGSDTAAFLQKQLAATGLTPQEYNEFIVYWLPQLEHNPYNLIHFAGSDYTNVAKLIIVPTPESELRVFMVYEPLQAPINIPPQSFPLFQRNGFTVVEWGGTEL